MEPAGQLARVYDAHAAALFAFLLNLTGSDADSRDLLQDLFVRLATRAGLLEDVRDPRAFLLRMAHRLFLDSLRRRGARDRYHAAYGETRSPLFEPIPGVDEPELRKALELALAGLPADQRAVVHLRLWEGLTFETIASTLDLPLNTAASRYRYGLDKIRSQLRPLYEEMK